MRAQSMGIMGNTDVQTPHLDRLASEGMLFRQTFANTPVCCPARAVILTGRYAHRNGVIANDLRLRESEITLAELLAEEGYRTGFVGKWHLDGGKRLPGYIPPGPRRQGFHYWAANQCSHRHFDSHYFRDSETPIPIDRFEPEVWTDLAIEFLSETRKQPFFLMVAMGPPHNPYLAPDRYMEIYQPHALTTRPNWVDGITRAGRQEIAGYYASITAVDEQVGRLLRALDELGLEENTIVLVTSDHGAMLGSQGLRLKRKPWEESIRVPGILRYPKQLHSPQAVDTLFSQADIAPTLLGLCGLAVPDHMQGTNLAPVILGEDGASSTDSVFFQIFGPYQSGGVTAAWRGVRTQHHMYARMEQSPWVLYNLQQDPYQLRNLVDSPECAPILADMEQRLSTWMEATGDSWKLNWTHPVEDAGRLYRFETFYSVDDYLKWAAENPDLAPAE